MLAVLLICLLLPAGIAAIGAMILRRLCPRYGRQRRSIIAALPYSLVIAGLCVFSFGRASLASPEECIPDRCGMAQMGAIGGLVYALVAFVIALAAAFIFIKTTETE